MSDQVLQEMGLRPGDEGIYRFEADGTLLFLEASTDGETYFLYAPVGEPSPESRKKIFYRALSGNLFGKETGYASLAFDEQSHQLMLIDRLPSALLEEKWLLDRVASFLHYLREWRREVDNPSSSSESEWSLEAHTGHLKEEHNLNLFFV